MPKAQVCVCQGGEAKQASKTKSSELVFFGLQQGLFSLSPQHTTTTTTKELSPFHARKKGGENKRIRGIKNK
jgi:hypothetical protein